MFEKIRKMKNKKGFTLVELIVVLVILAILAALRSPFLVGCRAGCPHPAEVSDRQNATGLADRRGGFHIRPWECP